MAPGWIVVICVVGFWILSATIFGIYLFKNLKKDGQLKQSINEKEKLLEDLIFQTEQLQTQVNDMTDNYNRVLVDK